MIRRFFVVEGFYINYGDLCLFLKLVEFKWKYKVRFFLEESLLFGVFGSNGKGVIEYYNIFLDDIDLIAVLLENVIGLIGGFCCGKKYIVDY